MALTGYSVLTPRRSPRLLAKRCSQRPQHTIDASVRDKLRKFVEQTEETEIELLDGLERYLVSQEATIFSSIFVSSSVARFHVDGPRSEKRRWVRFTMFKISISAKRS